MQGGRNVFLLCAGRGHLAVAEYLAPKMEGHLFDSDDGGYTALHWAAQEGQLPMVEYLVRSCGCDVKASDKVGLCLRICSYISNACENIFQSMSLYISYILNLMIFV